MGMFINGKWVGPLMNQEGGAGGGGGGGTDWRTAIADEKLRASPSLAKFKDVGGLAKSYHELEALQGSSIRKPGPDASAEDVAKFRQRVMELVPDAVVLPADAGERAKVEGSIWEKLGRPKEAKAYALPQGVELPENVLEALRKDSADLGLTQSQFAAAAKRAADGSVKLSAAEKEDLAALRKELGETFDERTAAAREMAIKLGVPKEAAAAMPARELRVWANVAKAIGGEPHQVGNQNGAGGGGKLAPAEARSQAAEIRQRLISEGHRLDPLIKKDLIEKMSRLDGIAAAGG
jgi:hypothetical protein